MLRTRGVCCCRPHSGPQVRGDLEDGCWAGNTTKGAPWGTNTPIKAAFVTAMLKGDSGNRWALKGGDAQRCGNAFCLLYLIVLPRQALDKTQRERVGLKREKERRFFCRSDGLMTLYEGPRPQPAYNPMKKQGAIILGTGGDNSNWAVGTFFEGVMASGFSTDATDLAVHANIAAAHYKLKSRVITSDPRAN